MKESGINIREAGTPSRRHHCSTTGMNTATTAVLFSRALKGPTTKPSSSS